MTEIYFGIGVAVFFAGGFALHVFIQWRRHHRSCREYLEPVLSEHGLSYVSERWAGWFKVGPFPMVEVEVGRPQSKVGGVRGEYSSYRIVTVADSEGNEHELWAHIDFELFRFRRARWRAEDPSKLPQEARNLLEA